MTDVEMVKKCLEDASRIYCEYMGWYDAKEDKIRHYVDRVDAVVHIAVELFNYRCTMYSPDWQDIPPDTVPF